MRLKAVTLCLVAATFCSATKVATASDDVVRDVQFYVQDAGERERQLTECEANPGMLRDAPNCINAAAAKKKVRTQQMRDAINKSK